MEANGAGRPGRRSPSMARRAAAAAAAGTLVAAGLYGVMARTGGPTAAPRQAQGRTAADTGSATVHLAQLPLAFADGGASSPSYVAEAPGYGVQVAADHVVLSLADRGAATGSAGGSAGGSLSAHTSDPTSTSRLQLDLVGADPNATLTTQGGLPGHVNVLVGARSSWRTGLPTYRTVVAHDAWPGIDVAYTGSDGSLEYRLDVAPGANPSSARLRLEGVTGLHVDAGGNLVGQSAAGPVSERSLTAFQVVGGTTRTVPVSYVVDGGTVSFRVGAYDHSLPLVIDPIVVAGTGTYLSSSSLAEVLGLTANAAGDIFVTGFTGGSGFPVTGSPTYAGGLTDAFVTELDPTGSSAIFSTYLGGMGEDVGTAISLGPSGSIYVAGYTDSPDFPIVGGTRNTNDNNILFGAENDGFLTVLAAGGSSVDASTLIGGSGEDEIEALAVDASGNARVGGLTTWNDFPGLGGTPGTSADLNIAHGYVQYGNYRSTWSYPFVATVDLSAGQLTLGPVTGFRQGGGSQVDAVTLDAAGDAIVAGGSGSYLAPQGGGYSGPALVSNRDGAFVASVSPSGSVNWLSWLGGAAQLYGVALDAAGDVDVVGAADAGFPVTAGTIGQSNTGRGPQAVAASLSPDGTTLRWATYLGGTGGLSEADALLIGLGGTIEVSGGTFSTTGVATAGAAQYALAGNENAFVEQLSPDATAELWGTYLGGSSRDWAMSMARVPGGIAIAGLTTSTDFPLTATGLQSAMSGSQAGFVATVAPPPTGYWLPASDGGVFGFGATPYKGSCPAAGSPCPGAKDIVGMVPMVSRRGYWLVGADGSVDAFGTAVSYGSVTAPPAPIVGMAAVPAGNGYWLAGADGAVYPFGSAVSYGSAASLHPAAPIVGIASTLDGKGYWLVGKDGGVFAYGDAVYDGSCPAAGSGCTGSSDIVGMAMSRGGTGYWLVGADGGVHPFGTAVSFGSMAGTSLNAPVVGIAPSPDGYGYWLGAADGGIFAFGDAPFLGSEGGSRLNAPVVGVAGLPAVSAG